MNRLIISPSALDKHINYSESAFILDKEVIEEDAFSFKEIAQAIGKAVAGAGKAVGTVVTGGLGVAAAAAPTLSSVLPQLGIGSKSRIAETNAIANANAQIINAQTAQLQASRLAENEKADDQKALLMIGGAFLLVMVAMMVAFRR